MPSWRSTAAHAVQATHFGFWPPLDPGMQTFGRMRFLYDMVSRHASRVSGNALEIGCFKGCSTVYLAKACAGVGITKVRSIDLFTGTPGWGQTFDTFDEANERMRRYGISRFVELIRADSREYRCPDESIDVLHVDGDHSYGAASADIERFAPLVSPGGLVVFDDYDASHEGVVRAVHELLARDRSFTVVAVNHRGEEWGSLCLRRATT